MFLSVTPFATAARRPFQLPHRRILTASDTTIILCECLFLLLHYYYYLDAIEPETGDDYTPSYTNDEFVVGQFFHENPNTI